MSNCEYEEVPGDPAIRICVTHNKDFGLYGEEFCAQDSGLEIADPPPVTLLNEAETGLVSSTFELLVSEANSYLKDGSPTKFFDTTSSGALSREELSDYRDKLAALLAKLERI